MARSFGRARPTTRSALAGCFGLTLGAGGAARIIVGDSRLQSPSCGIENSILRQTPLLQSKLQRGREYSKAILHAAPKINGRGFGKIFRGTRNFSDLESKVRALGQHLIVENEIVRIFQQWQFRQNFLAERAVAAVIFGNFNSKKQVFKRRQKTIEHILVSRYPPAQRLSANDSRP